MRQDIKSARFEARIPPDVHAIIKRAAEIEGRSMTDYVMATALDAARNTIEQTDTIKLSMKSSEDFASSLINPSKPAPAMVRAGKRHSQMFTSE